MRKQTRKAQYSKRRKNRNSKKNNRRSRNSKKNKKGRRYSIKKARMISKKRYGELLNKKRLTKKEEKELDRALFVNYCKCIKKIKYSNEYEVGKEYPICMSSIYKKRGRTAPKGVTKKCKRYY